MRRSFRIRTPLVLSSLLFVALAVFPREPLSAQEDVTVLLPIVNLPASVGDAVVAQGSLMLGGLPLANTPFELRTCDGEEEQLLATGITDAVGAYQVHLPVGDPASPLSAMLVYPAADTPPARASLASFTSVCVTSTSVSLPFPNVELAAADFVSPAKGDAVDMPILFAWEPRTYPGEDEMYQVVGSILYDCANCEPITISAAALPHPSSSILLECVYTARRAALSAEFRVMVSNASGVGYSDPYAFKIGITQRCQD